MRHEAQSVAGASSRLLRPMRRLHVPPGSRDQQASDCEPDPSTALRGIDSPIVRESSNVPGMVTTRSSIADETKKWIGGLAFAQRLEATPRGRALSEIRRPGGNQWRKPRSAHTRRAAASAPTAKSIARRFARIRLVRPRWPATARTTVVRDTCRAVLHWAG